MSDLKALYDEDFFAWTKEQAEVLRSAARGGSNRKLDWENLAEEIEDLGKRERRELSSRLSAIIEHLVKLQESPAPDPRNGWRATIRRERTEIERVLKDNRSLRRQIPRLIKEAIPYAAREVIAELEDRGELASTTRTALKASSYLDLFSYTPDQILGDWFPPAPQG
jgi:hypothetical protein